MSDLTGIRIWQRKRIVPVHKIGRTVIFSMGDLTEAMTRFRMNAVGE
jgi:hypothetical protein